MTKFHQICIKSIWRSQEKNEHRPSFVKIEENLVKDPIAEYILAKPKENQIIDITYQIMQIVGNMYPIVDQEIKIYIGRILKSMNTEQLQDILVRKWSYTDKIKGKTRQLASLPPQSCTSIEIIVLFIISVYLSFYL